MRRSASVVAFVGILVGAAFDAHALFIVNQPWVKPGTRNTEGYMILTSTEGATLIGVRSSIAVRVSLRGPGGHGRARASMAPAGAAVALRRGTARPSPLSSLDLPSCLRFPRIYIAAHATPPRSRGHGRPLCWSVGAAAAQTPPIFP
jgi:hypothetical protein